MKKCRIVGIVRTVNQWKIILNISLYCKRQQIRKCCWDVWILRHTNRILTIVKCEKGCRIDRIVRIVIQLKINRNNSLYCQLHQLNKCCCEIWILRHKKRIFTIVEVWIICKTCDSNRNKYKCKFVLQMTANKQVLLRTINAYIEIVS